MKKVIILTNNGGQLANQLWNYASIYAYCLEKNYRCENPSFYRYIRHFPNINNTLLSRIYSIIPFKRAFRVCHTIFVRLYRIFINDVKSDNEFFLEPTNNDNVIHREIMTSAERGNKIFFSGWLFRNPLGMEKFHQEIIEKFKPNENVVKNVNMLLNEAKSRGKYCIGLHIRQGDYRVWQGGKYYVCPKDSVTFIKQFIEGSKKYVLDECVFLICSDEKIGDKVFEDMNIIHGPGSVIGDLYALSLTDHIIGYNSTYGRWAAYYGKVAFTVLERI